MKYKESLMKRRGKYLRILLAVILLVGTLQAEEIKKIAQTSMKWLAIPVSARSLSMGSASFCLSGGADNIFSNPASTGFIEAPQLSIGNLPWIAGITQNAAVFALPLGNIGVLTGSFRQIDFGEQEGTVRSSNQQGWAYTEPFSPSAFQAGLGFSKRMTDRFSYGLHLSYARENLAEVNYAPVLTGSMDSVQYSDTDLDLFDLDVGVLYYTGFHDLRLGMTLKNFSEEKGYGNVGNPIPMDWRFGMAMDLLAMLPGDSDMHQLTFTWDLSHPRDYSERLHFGLEYVFAQMVALRAGYKANYDEEDLSFGAGLISPRIVGSLRFNLDYAYVPLGVFGSVQAFSVTLKF